MFKDILQEDLMVVHDMDPQFIKTINRRLSQLTSLVENNAPDDLIQFQFTQFVAMVAEKAQELYGKLEYGDLIIEVKKKDPEQYRAEQIALLEKELEKVKNV